MTKFESGFLICSLLLFISSASNADISSSFTNAAKKSDGSMQMMSVQEAKTYCFSIGARLPTAREYAQLATTVGAKGIRETAFPNSTDWIRQDSAMFAEVDQMTRQEFNPVYQVNDNGATVVDFYYGDIGYKYRKSDALFLTSSRVSEYSFALFQDSTGSLDYGSTPSNKNAVRCFKP